MTMTTNKYLKKMENPTEKIFIYYCIELHEKQKYDRIFPLNPIVCLKNEKY